MILTQNEIAGSLFLQGWRGSASLMRAGGYGFYTGRVDINDGGISASVTRYNGSGTKPSIQDAFYPLHSLGRDSDGLLTSRGKPILRIRHGTTVTGGFVGFFGVTDGRSDEDLKTDLRALIDQLLETQEVDEACGYIHAIMGDGIDEARIIAENLLNKYWPEQKGMHRHATD